MRNYMRYLCIILSLGLSISLFSACSDQGTESNQDSSLVNSDVNSEEIASSETQNTFDDEIDTDTWYEYESEYIEDNAFSEDDDFIATINVKNNESPAMTDYLGLNGIYHGYMYLKDSDNRVYTEEQAALEYSRIKQMGLKNVRSYYYSGYAYENGAWNWESGNMLGFYRWAKDMQNADIDICLNAGWQLLSLTNSSQKPFALPGVFVDGDLNTTLKNYSAWMVESLKQFRAHGINNIKYLMMFTEPEEFPRNQTCLNDEVEDLSDPAFDNWLAAVKALDAGLKAANMRSNYKLVGPNSTGYTITKNGIYVNPMFVQAVNYANDYIDIFSNHSYLYQNEDPTNDVAELIVDPQWKDHADYAKEHTGKDFWCDEYNVAFGNDYIGTKSNPWYALHIGITMAVGMRSGVKNQILWTIADQQWPDNHTYNDDGFENGIQKHGILPSLFESTIPKVSYYGVSLLTKYFGKGDVYFTDYDYVYSGSEKNEDGWSVFAVNMDPLEGIETTINFEKSIGSKVLYRHLYSVNDQKTTAEAKLIGIDKVVFGDGVSFTDELPPACIAVYTTERY